MKNFMFLVVVVVLFSACKTQSVNQKKTNMIDEKIENESYKDVSFQELYKIIKDIEWIRYSGSVDTIRSNGNISTRLTLFSMEEYLNVKYFYFHEKNQVEISFMLERSYRKPRYTCKLPLYQEIPENLAFYDFLSGKVVLDGQPYKLNVSKIK